MAFDKASSLVALGGAHGATMVVQRSFRPTVSPATVLAMNGMSQLAAVALSPDGRHLVVAGVNVQGEVTTRLVWPPQAWTN